MDTAQPSNVNAPINAQNVMPWFMGAAWIPKCGGDKGKFSESRTQVEANLTLCWVGEAKLELKLVTLRDKDSAQKVLDILEKLHDKPITKD